MSKSIWNLPGGRPSPISSSAARKGHFTSRANCMQILMILKASEGEASKMMEGLLQFEFVLWKMVSVMRRLKPQPKLSRTIVFNRRPSPSPIRYILNGQNQIQNQSAAMWNPRGPGGWIIAFFFRGYGQSALNDLTPYIYIYIYTSILYPPPCRQALRCVCWAQCRLLINLY